MDDAKKETQSKSAGAEKPSSTGKRPVSIRLAPVEGSDQPVFANHCSINISPGVAFIDFGFIEPGMLGALPRVQRSGGKLPERIDGILAVRVAMGYDAIAYLHQQIGPVLKGLREAQAARGGTKGAE